ncbi:gas vesicle protein GvpJ [Dactylosporangium sp. CA-233914]|uniref:gas vesicle protein GvpJ n=1 Tax=Dactylosporangium sp. CA-233914 TaxID=3239934 RepID=UPI003D8C84A0
MSSTSMQQRGGSGIERPTSTSLAEVIDTILDKGLVIDAYVRVSLVGIELLTIDARIVVASVDTYLRFAEAVNRLDISQEKAGLPELVGDIAEGGAKHKVKGGMRGALDAAGDKLRDVIDAEPEPERVSRRRRREED